MLTSAQLRAARAMLQWRAVDLAERAGVNLSTIQRAEKTEGAVAMMPSNERAVRATLEEAGIQFIAQNGGGPGVRLREPPK